MKDNQAKYPQLRFKGFTDPWVQRKLGDIVVFLNGRAYKQAELLDSGKYPILTNIDLCCTWHYPCLYLFVKLIDVITLSKVINKILIAHFYVETDRINIPCLQTGKR